MVKRMGLALGVACSLQLSACGGAPAAVHTVSLRLRGTGTPSATVTVDDQRIGPLASVRARGIALPPGQHTVSVESPGFFPWDQVVVAPNEANQASGTSGGPNQNGGKPIFLDVQLVKIPD